MINNYDKIASHYDTLSRMIFFKSQVNAQIDQLRYLPENSSILIAGGGTGWILDEITKCYPAGLFIAYIELSAKMIVKSKARNIGSNEVVFVNIGIENYTTDKRFDVILTPFLFDNFEPTRAANVFQILDNLLKKNGLWFLVDFSLNPANGKWWKWIILKSMYAFFKLLHIVEANNLIDMSSHFFNADYQLTDERFYYKSFIKAVIYRKR